MGFYNTTAYFW